MRSALLEDLARSLDGASGLVAGLKREVDSLVQERMRRHLLDMDLVTREEFEIVRALAVEAREENARLKARLSALEDQRACSDRSED